MDVKTDNLHRTYKSAVFQEYCKQALETFRSMKWPTIHDEQWHRTDISYLDLESFTPWNASEQTKQHTVSDSHAGEYLLSSDGEISIGSTDPKIDIYDARLNMSHSPQFDQLRKGYIDCIEHKFSAWNLTWASFAPTVYVHPDTKSAKPIYIHIDLSAEQVLLNSQTSIIVDRGAQASVIVRVSSREGGELVHNASIATYLADNATLDLFVIQEDNIDVSSIGSFYTQVHNDARMKFVGMNKGAMLSKYTVYSDIQGKGSEALMDGIFYPHNDEQVDVRSVQRHRVGKSYSRALFKGAVADEAHSVFQGLIHVDPGANDTDAYLTNNNLVLSEHARADSIPTLQIETNDLRCSHGATIGMLDEEQLTYLCTRGINPDDATSMLAEGHFEEIISLFPESIADDVRQRLLF